MEVIPVELVEKTWEEVSAFSPDRANKEMMKLSKRQPNLLEFIMGITQDMNQDVQELAIYMFFVVCRIFEKGSTKKIKKISLKEIIKCHESNIEFMESLEGTHEKILERIASIQLSDQPYIMMYVVTTLMETPDEDDPVDLTEEDIGYLFLILKTVMDLLDRAA
ncbi:MAG: hypothetical protein IMF10_09630 [Proteobacteria bacterium]|nr:hypothetical protein [Pseudomonadota bacterium]